jgi:hypothetical protein
MAVYAEALYHVKPLPPYHHVPNADKSSRYTEARPASITQTTEVAQAVLAGYEGMDLPRTTTWPLDFWPVRWTKVDKTIPYARPPLLALEFIPREKVWITEQQRDSWDYVLRHLFVRPATPIRDAMSSLGFGATNLLKAIQDPDSGYNGDPASEMTHARDLTVAQWARIVDVFDKWPFKPKVRPSEYCANIVSTFSPRPLSIRVEMLNMFSYHNYNVYHACTPHFCSANHWRIAVLPIFNSFNRFSSLSPLRSTVLTPSLSSSSLEAITSITNTSSS